MWTRKCCKVVEGLFWKTVFLRLIWKRHFQVDTPIGTGHRCWINIVGNCKYLGIRGAQNGGYKIIGHRLRPKQNREQGWVLMPCCLSVESCQYFGCNSSVLGRSILHSVGCFISPPLPDKWLWSCPVLWQLKMPLHISKAVQVHTTGSQKGPSGSLGLFNFLISMVVTRLSFLKNCLKNHWAVPLKYVFLDKCYISIKTFTEKSCGLRFQETCREKFIILIYWEQILKTLTKHPPQEAI